MVEPSIDQLLKELHQLDVKLWVEEGQLHSDAPKGAITPTLRTQIRARKEELIVFLSQAAQDRERGNSPIQPAPRAASDDLPLSFMQESLWLLLQVETENTAYNEVGAVQIDGALQVETFQRALAEIVHRHEALRTTFSANAAGEPIQIIHPPAFDMPFLDLSHLTAAQQSAKIQALAQQEARTVFDLETGPLFRCKLLHLNTNIRSAASSHVLLFAMHHLIGDAWSTGLLIQELSTLYAAFVAGEPSPLPDLPIQYVDYAVWQRTQTQEDHTEHYLDYWREKLADAPTLLQLPTDHARPNKQTFRGGRTPFTVAADCVQQLAALAQQAEATLFMTLLTAFKILLARYSGQQDIVIGSPVANRQQRAVESLIGFFVNTTVYRTQLSDSQSFVDLLAQVKQTAEDAYAHQDVSFASIVSAIQPERDLSYSPLFQVMFSYQNVPTIRDLDMAGLRLNRVEMDLGICKYDLTLELYESANGLSGTFEYNTDLFDEATIERLAEHFAVLLQGITSQPDQPILQLPLLTETEYQQIVHLWNQTAVDLGKPQTIQALFEQQVARTPDAVALVFEEEQLTYAALNGRANQLAHHLINLGVQPDTLVAVAIERSPEMVVSLLAVLKAGGAYVPIDPSYPAIRIHYMLTDSAAPILLTQSHLSLFDRVESPTRHVIAVDRMAQPLATQSTQNPHTQTLAEHLAYVIYTSGSTGNPKGVMVNHSNVANFFQGMDPIIAHDPPGTWLAVTSLSFDISVLELFWTLARGFKVVLYTEHHKAAPSRQYTPLHTDKEMEFSLAYFASDLEHEDTAGQYDLFLQGAQFADQHGFSAIWTPERHFHEFGGLYPNPSVASAAIAALTERVAIRAGSCVLPLHNPIRVAEEWAFVDNLSHGRVGISFASGWHPNDFVLSPENYADRKAIMFRDIDTVRRLWRGETLALPAGDGNLVDVQTRPRPVQDDLPIWVTSSGSPETFRMAGEAGFNVLTHLLGQSIEELREKLAIYRAGRATGGHSGPGHVTLMLHTFIGDDIDEVREIVREPMRDYLRGSALLMKQAMGSFSAAEKPPTVASQNGHTPFDPEKMSAEEMTAEEMAVLLDHAFERYFVTNGLFGTPETCLETVDKLKGIGIDELACLIDFGVEADTVLEHLEHLSRLKDLSMPLEAETLHDSPAISYDIPSLINRHGVTHLQCTPSMMRMLLDDDASGVALSRLQCVLIGGEAFPAQLAQELQAIVTGEIVNMYGPTETTIWSSTHPLDTSLDVVPIGRPIINTEMYILNRAMKPVPIGVPGELYIGGEGVVRGYLQRPELNAQRFVPNPFSNDPHTRLYRTGDLARFRADGVINFLGRTDHQVKLRGHRIELGEIENILLAQDQVSEAVVLVREEGEDKRLVTYIVQSGKVAEGQGEEVDSAAPQLLTSPHVVVGDCNPATLRLALVQQLPDYMIPSAFVMLDAMPLTPNGKLDRRALAERPLGADYADAQQEFVAPRDELEEQLASIWGNVLGLEQVGIYDNFFALGGHSLLAMQTVSRIRRLTKVELPLRLLFQMPNVRMLAKEIKRLQASQQPSMLPPLEPAPREEMMPLSYAQTRMWFLTQLEGSNRAYHVPLTIEITGPLDVAALRQSWEMVVARHEALRTRYHMHDGIPYQQILAHVQIDFQYESLTSMPDVSVDAWLEERVQAPFELSEEVPWHLHLLAVAPEQHILLLVLHHITTDSWSTDLLWREWRQLYAAIVQGESTTLATLPVQYADYALWQRQWLTGETLNRHLDFWRQQLANAPTLLALPTDHPRPAVQRYRGASIPFDLGSTLTTEVQTLSVHHGVTPFMTLLAAFQILLHRYSGQDDIVIGSPIANRTQLETEGMVGTFTNTLALRSRLADNPTFTDLLGQVRDTMQAAYEHQALPFEVLLDALQPERTLSHAPLFQVMFALENMPQHDLNLHDLSLRVRNLPTTTTKFDLTLILWEGPEGFSGVWEYDSDLFDVATIERMIQHYQTLLGNLVLQSERPVLHASMLTDSEHHQIVWEWNNTTVDFGPPQTIDALFEQQVARTPDAVAVSLGNITGKPQRVPSERVIANDLTLSYSELNIHANQLAHHLIELGIEADTLVAVAMERSLEMVVSVLAILKARGAYVPIDPTYPQERIRTMLEDSTVPILLTQSHLAWVNETISPIKHVINVDTVWEELATQPITNPQTQTTSSDLAYVIYTSGSTGQPKGVTIPHHNLVNLVLDNIQAFAVSQDSIVMHAPTFGFDVEVGDFFMALCSGATLYLPAPQKLIGQFLRDQLRKSQATHVSLTPTALSTLHPEPYPHLQQMIIAGEALPDGMAHAWLQFTTVWNAYGPTENTIYTTATQCRADASVHIGKPISNVRAFILDGLKQPVPIGIAGELYIGGEQLARGYWNRPELTAERFVEHAELGRLYKTGDLCRYLPDGNIEFLGRIDHQVKLRGFRIELGEIEAVLSQHSSVEHAVVVVYTDDGGEQRLVAYVVARRQGSKVAGGQGESDALDPATLRTFLQQKLPEYMVPTAFVQLDALPLNPNGKVDRRALPMPEASALPLTQSFVPPRTSTEIAIAQIWSEILGIEQCGVHDNFFDLGGHSLLATQAVTRIRDRFQLDVSLQDFFQQPTIATMATTIDQVQIVQDLSLTPEKLDNNRKELAL